MPILNSIKMAEEKAKILRDDAEAKVVILLEENQIHVGMTVKEIETAGEKSRSAADQNALKTIETLRLDVEKRTKSALEKISSEAQKRTAEAAAFLVKKVLKS